MGDQDIADAILAMMRLPPDERATVMYVIGRMAGGDGVTKSDPPITRKASAETAIKANNNRKPYTAIENHYLQTIADKWDTMSGRVRCSEIDSAARVMRRNAKAIREQIRVLKNRSKPQ